MGGGAGDAADKLVQSVFQKGQMPWQEPSIKSQRALLCLTDVAKHSSCLAGANPYMISFLRENELVWRMNAPDLCNISPGEGMPLLLGFWPKTGCIHEPNMFILPKEVPQTGISQKCCSRSWRKGPKVTERPPLNVLQVALILLLRSQIRATAWHKPCTQASRSVLFWLGLRCCLIQEHIATRFEITGASAGTLPCFGSVHIFHTTFVRA